MFPGEKDLETFESILRYYSVQEMNDYVLKYNLTLPKNLVPFNSRRELNYTVSLDIFVCDRNKDVVDEDSLDLLKQMLTFDHVN